MIMLIGQMLGCLIVAAGIGGAVGWLLRHRSAGQLAQQFMDVTTTLRLREQTLEKVQYELKVKAAAMQILESKMIASEALHQSTPQELSSRQERIHALQEELAATRQRLLTLESGEAALLSRVSDSEASTIAQAQELQQSNDACQAAQQALILKEQELLPLHEHLVVLEHHLADVDRLRARIQELEPAQGRVHWLEVQLSERDTQHRTALLEVERQLADRDQRIGEFEQLHQQLTEQEAACDSWKAKYTHAVQQATAETAQSQKIRTRVDDLQAQLTLHEQRLREKDDHIATLQRHIDASESVQREMAGRAMMVDEKEEEISRLRKRLVEVRAALRIRTDGGVAPHPVQPAGDQLSLQIGQTKPSTAPPKDDLKEIRGIGPAFERVLNNMGIVTFRQVAQWNVTDMQQIAAKLATVPDRIKRDKWIAGAKKLHEQKYGKRL
jgi:predicted flap endonuclease-1-like 5' DNA nuclease/chromosome segregation ATPase